MNEITREQIIRKVAERANYYQRDVRAVFNALEDVVVESFDGLDEDNPISVRILSYLSLRGTVWGERERVNPQDRSPIICKPTCRILGKVSDRFKSMVQERFEEQKRGNEDE